MAARRFVSSARRTLSLDGVFVPLTTPFNLPRQEINYEKLNFNLNKYEKIPFAGYVVAGSNGEAPYLVPEERIELVRQVRRTVDKSKSVIGGATHESTKIACELCKEMAKVGADGVLVMAPFYFKKRMTDEAIMNHYTRVADESPIPVVIYNMPFVTGIDISIPVLAKLAHHPNIRGVKDGDKKKEANLLYSLILLIIKGHRQRNLQKESQYSTRLRVLITSATITNRIRACAISNSDPESVLDCSANGSSTMPRMSYC
ncbi:4-hydroxy-2-oxoglutarate aldolase, mitochondrial [Homalodisca vitripennis]|nr:4-hydroxy-2-oxoglutarate aldolase, mitochondrial [Homalodisca vitripennis]